MKTIKNNMIALMLMVSTIASGQIYYGNSANTIPGLNTLGQNTVAGTFGYNLTTYMTNLYGGSCNANSQQISAFNGTTSIPSATFGVYTNSVSGAFTVGGIFHSAINGVITGSINMNTGNFLPYGLDTGLIVIGYKRTSPTSTVMQTMHIALCPTVIPTPTANFSQNNSTICASSAGSFTFNNTSSPGLLGGQPYRSKYIWNNGTSTTVISPSSVSPSTFTANIPSTPGTYTVSLTVQNWSGPNFTSSTKVGTVTVVANPTLAVVVTPTAICAGQSATLTVNGNASTYLWIPTSSTVTTRVVTPSTTTNYSVWGFSGNCSSSTVAAQVVVNANPTVTASNATICAGSSVTLSASGASTYVWSSGSNVSPVSTTAYTVTGTSNGCTSTAVSTVVVNANPTVMVTSPSTVCLNSNASLVASGASTYSWSNGSSGSTLSYSSAVAQTTVFTVTGFNAAGCSNSATVSIEALDCTTTNTNTTGISKNSIRPDFNVYPNPTTSVFNVKYVGSIEVFDIGGRLVLTREVDGIVELDLAPGLYIIRFDGAYSHKVIKQQ